MSSQIQAVHVAYSVELKIIITKEEKETKTGCWLFVVAQLVEEEKSECWMFIVA